MNEEAAILEDINEEANPLGGEGVRVARPRRFFFLQSENPFVSYRDDEFFSVFGFSKNHVNELVDLVRDALSPRIQRRTVLDAERKMLIFLDYVRGNSLQRVVGRGRHTGTHQTTVSRVIEQVADALNRRYHEYIYMPDEEEKDEIAAQFASRDHFPGVFGCIDGCEVQIKRPPYFNVPQPERFFNRKARYAINLMIICDNRYRIRFYNGRYPGCVHDARIWNESGMKQLLHIQFNPEKPRYLVGDEGYPCSNILLTPIGRVRANNLPKRRYNRRLRNTRWRIESCFGVLKSRFRILLHEQRTCLRVTRKVIKAVMILHNYWITNCGGGLPEVDAAEARLQQEMQENFDQALQQQTANEDPNNYIRQRLVENVFT